MLIKSQGGHDWDRTFANKHVGEKVSVFNKTVSNILSNFIFHEVIVYDDKDLPWFNAKISQLIKKKIKTYNAYRKNISSNQLREQLSSLQRWLSDLIDDSKQKYFLRLSEKLNAIQNVQTRIGLY